MGESFNCHKIISSMEKTGVEERSFKSHKIISLKKKTVEKWGKL